MISHAIVAIALSGYALAQQAAYDQCGGSGWSGGSTCVAGYSCVPVNQWYSQCQAGTQATQTSPSSTATPSKGKFKWLGVDESVAEWGTVYPGVAGKDYTFPSTTAIDTLIAQGYNIFRVPFAMERMAVGSITANFEQGYLNGYFNVIDHITKAGAWAIVDPHNYGRYNGAIITDTNAFATFWKNLATVFKSNTKVIFDINNEFNTMPQDVVHALNQAGINAIRSVGATSQYIFAEGNNWTGTSTWAATNDDLKTLSDPNNNLIYEMHEYLNSDGSGATMECASASVGVDRISGATAWLRANGKKGVLGEFAGGANDLCKTAVQNLLNHMTANSDVWLGALWWAGGPWWANVVEYDFEPPTGKGYQTYNSILKNYLP